MKTILILRHLIQNQDFGEAQSDWLVLTGRHEDQVFRIPTRQDVLRQQKGWPGLWSPLLREAQTLYSLGAGEVHGSGQGQGGGGTWMRGSRVRRVDGKGNRFLCGQLGPKVRPSG